MGQDKRKQKRLDANLFVEMESPSGDILGRGVVVDVSLSGFAMDSEMDIAINNEVTCHMEVPLKMRAVVIRCVGRGQLKRYGLRFVGQGFLDKLLFRKVLQGNRKTKKISQ